MAGFLDVNVWDLEDVSAIDAGRRFRQSAFFRHLRQGDSILDLGCGPGVNVRILRDNGYRVLGVDTNAEAVRRAVDLGLPVVEADALEAVRRLGADHTVFMMLDLIEHVPLSTAMELLGQIAARRPARLFLSTPNLDSLMGFKFWFHMPTHINPMHPFVLRRVLARSGFRVLAEWTEYGNLPGRGWKLRLRRKLLYALFGTQAELFIGGANLCLVAEAGGDSES